MLNIARRIVTVDGGGAKRGWLGGCGAQRGERVQSQLWAAAEESALQPNRARIARKVPAETGPPPSIRCHVSLFNSTKQPDLSPSQAHAHACPGVSARHMVSQCRAQTGACETSPFGIVAFSLLSPIHSLVSLCARYTAFKATAPSAKHGGGGGRSGAHRV